MYMYLNASNFISVILAEGKSEQNFDPMPRSWWKQPPFGSLGGCGG